MRGWSSDCMRVRFSQTRRKDVLWHGAMVKPWQWSLATLETLIADDQIDQHTNMLRAVSVVELWQLRHGCWAFHR